VSCERIVPTGELLTGGGIASLRIHRWMIEGVVEAPNGAHFTSCAPDYERDEEFQRGYAAAAADPAKWAEFMAAYLRGSEADYQRAVAARADHR
jgi:glutaconate CoA-transferase subunit A